MTISLPEPVKELVDQLVASGAYPSAEAYICSLVEADVKRKAKEALETLIVEGLDSGAPTEMTAQDWEDIRREGLARARKEKRA